MHQRYYAAAIVFAGLLTLGSFRAFGQQNNNSGEVQVQMTVSAEAHHGDNLPPITREDVLVEEGHDHDTITKWVPATGPNAGADLLILVDDTSVAALGTQFPALRDFMMAQPPTTFIGVGYMQNGTVQMAQNFTNDHAAAAKSLRLPLGVGAGIEASPYFSISDYVVKHWPESPERPRHLMLMLSDGVDAYYGGGPLDPYVESAISDAQRAGIMIFSIYTPGTGHAGHSFYLDNWGQNYLSEISEKTGGENYWIGLGGAVDFSPYLKQLSTQLQHQYLLRFIPKPEKKAELQRVHVSTEVRDVDLNAAQKVWVPATPD